MRKHAIIIGIIALLLYIGLVIWSNKVNATGSVSSKESIPTVKFILPDGHEDFKFGTPYTQMPEFKICTPLPNPELNAMDCLRVANKRFYGFKVDVEYRIYDGKFVGVRIQFLPDNENPPYLFNGVDGNGVVNKILLQWGTPHNKDIERLMMGWNNATVKIEWYVNNNRLYIMTQEYAKILMNQYLDLQIKNQRKGNNENGKKTAPKESTSKQHPGNVSGRELE